MSSVDERAPVAQRRVRGAIMAALGLGGLAAVAGACGAMSAKAPSAPAGAGGDPSSSSTGSGRGTSVADRLIERTFDLEVETKHPADAVAATRKIAAELDGFVLSTVEDGNGESRATMRVPAARADAATERLHALGKVVEEHVRGEDVTDAVRDLGIRLENARRTRDAYVALLARAATVEQTLAVEKELERVTIEIETLEGQLTELETGVKLATFELAFHRPLRPGPVGWIFYGGYHVIKWLFVWD
jgi:hypothetical protein